MPKTWRRGRLPMTACDRLVCAVVATFLMPASAFASCESALVVNSRELAFTYSDPTSLDVEPLTPSGMHAHFRGLAHALAVAKACFDSVRTYTCEAGTPPRTRLRLAPGSAPLPIDTGEVAALDLASRCAAPDRSSAS